MTCTRLPGDSLNNGKIFLWVYNMHGLYGCAFVSEVVCKIVKSVLSDKEDNN